MFVISCYGRKKSKQNGKNFKNMDGDWGSNICWSSIWPWKTFAEQVDIKECGNNKFLILL